MFDDLDFDLMEALAALCGDPLPLTREENYETIKTHLSKSMDWIGCSKVYNPVITQEGKSRKNTKTRLP